MARGRRPGTRPKGERSAITTRVPEPHRDVYAERADAVGMPLSDYIALCMARMHRLSEPDYINPNRDHEELDLELDLDPARELAMPA